MVTDKVYSSRSNFIKLSLPYYTTKCNRFKQLSLMSVVNINFPDIRKNEFAYQSFSSNWYVRLESVDSVQKNSFSENLCAVVPF